MLVDFDVSEDLEPDLVRIVHEEEGDAGVVLEIPCADVLLIATKVREAEEFGTDDMDETFGASAMLYVGPAGLADGGHVEAVAKLDEVLLIGAQSVANQGRLFHTLILTAAAVLNLQIFNKGCERQFLETAHLSGTHSEQVDTLPEK